MLRKLTLILIFLEHRLKMVAAAAFPIAKLGILLVKQISKPLANSITSRARCQCYKTFYVRNLRMFVIS
jgi:hypothetical protein